MALSSNNIFRDEITTKDNSSAVTMPRSYGLSNVYSDAAKIMCIKHFVNTSNKWADYGGMRRNYLPLSYGFTKFGYDYLGCYVSLSPNLVTKGLSHVVFGRSRRPARANTKDRT